MMNQSPLDSVIAHTEVLLRDIVLHSKTSEIELPILPTHHCIPTEILTHTERVYFLAQDVLMARKGCDDDVGNLVYHSMTSLIHAVKIYNEELMNPEEEDEKGDSHKSALLKTTGSFQRIHDALQWATGRKS